MAAAASAPFNASAAADATHVVFLSEIQEQLQRVMVSLRAGTPLADLRNDVSVLHAGLNTVHLYLTDPGEKERAETHERRLHQQKERLAAEQKRHEHARICMETAEVLTPSELEKRVKDENLAEVCKLAGYYGELSWIGYYYVDDDHWITGPKEGSPDEYRMIYGLGWEAKHNDVTDRVTVEYGGEEWFVGFFSVLDQGEHGLHNAVVRRLRALGCVTV